MKQKLPPFRPPSSAGHSNGKPSRMKTHGNGKPARNIRALAKLPRVGAGFIEPMQPALVERLPEGPEAQYEVKWDGYRVIAVKSGDKVTLLSRRANQLTARYPSIAHAVAGLRCKSTVIDGEILALDAKGRPSFQLLQNYASGKSQIVFIAFDLQSRRPFAPTGTVDRASGMACKAAETFDHPIIGTDRRRFENCNSRRQIT